LSRASNKLIRDSISGLRESKSSSKKSILIPRSSEKTDASENLGFFANCSKAFSNIFQCCGNDLRASTVSDQIIMSNNVTSGISPFMVVKTNPGLLDSKINELEVEPNFN
jgi:hypothetical protein